MDEPMTVEEVYEMIEELVDFVEKIEERQNAVDDYDRAMSVI